MNGDEQRILGEHGARLAAIEDNLEKIDVKVDTLVERMAAGTGGLRVLTALTTLAGLIGALIERWITSK